MKISENNRDVIFDCNIRAGACLTCSGSICVNSEKIWLWIVIARKIEYNVKKGGSVDE